MNNPALSLRAVSPWQAGGTRVSRLSVPALLNRARVNAWMVLAAVLVVAGGLGAVFGAYEVSRSEAGKARLAFHLASAEVASRLKLVIQHEEDLVINASAFVTRNPSATAADFDRWVESVDALRRYPELQNIGLVKLVPASGLAAFQAHMAANPLRPLGPVSSGPAEPFAILPLGRRPHYCFAVAGMARSLASYLPAGVDYCALAPTLISGRDSGLTSYAPFNDGTVTTLGVETPVYRGGVVPVASLRRRAFIGWLGELLVPKVVLDAARAGHPSLAVTLRYDSSYSHVAFASGTISRGAQSTRIDLHNDWSVESFRTAGATGMLSNWHALSLLIGGLLLSVLFGMLVLVLATGRRRALSLVREKTRELSHQATHDALTGLPNRSLVYDRAAQLLARAERRTDMFVGAMFIDIDDFKQVNDGLGHAAGDELLKSVAERLQRAAREQDTVGRLGGDEFVVVAELTDGDASADTAARALADRMIEFLHQPVELGDGQSLRSVKASVGVAVGRFASPEAMLRDADLALYAAKGAGKDRYVLFGASAHDVADSTRGEENGRTSLVVGAGS